MVPRVKVCCINSVEEAELAVSMGASALRLVWASIDPTKKPKTIDLKPTDGDDKGKTYLGIYELGEDTRKLCISQVDKQRPTEFSSEPGREQILVTFEREKGK